MMICEKDEPLASLECAEDGEFKILMPGLSLRLILDSAFDYYDGGLP